jgi:N-methylhydantoinase B
MEDENATKDRKTDGVDLIRIEVLRNKLTSIANEMGSALQRTAYSTNIKTRQDFSCAIFDRSLRAVAQSFSQPVHLGSLVHFVPRIIAEYGLSQLRPGDGLLCNDGFLGGVHLNDVCLVTPVFHRGSLVAFVATLAHHLDVGGATPGSLVGLSKEVFAEGLRIPPVRFLEKGRINSELLKFIQNNIRSPRETSGDLRAQAAAVNTGVQRMQEMFEKYGLETVDSAIEEILSYTERRTREEITKLPTGVFSAVGDMDGDGIIDKPFQVKVKLTIGQGMVRFDLSGSAPQQRGPINATYAMTLSNCAYALRVLLSPELPVNDGFYRVMEVIAPPGSVVNALHPAAIGGGWETAFRVCETALQAFGKVIPERLAAGSKGALCNIAFGGISPRSGNYYVFYEAMGGGYGARATKDGIDAVQPHGQNTENSPIEETEANYPVLISRYELIQDSEGPGRFRGGLGLRRDYLFDHEVTFSVLSERAKFPPWGLQGGGPARAAHYVVNPGKENRECGSKTSTPLRPGDVFSVQMGGGGGYGPPWERSIEKVVQDIHDGRISAERARTAYGVVVDSETGSADTIATQEERDAKRREDLKSPATNRE